MDKVNELTGTALSRAVAEKLGWRVQQYFANSHNHRVANGDNAWSMPPFETDEETLEYAIETGCVPDFATDANAALALTVDGFKLELRRSSTTPEGVWFAQYYNDDFINCFTGLSSNPAEAICKAYLATKTM